MNELLLRRRMMVTEAEEKPYLRFTALEDNSSVAFGVGGGTPPERTMSYSKNGGAFLDYTTEDVITIDEGEYVEFKRRGNVIKQLSTSTSNYNKFKMTGKIAVSGNIMSILDESLASTHIGAYCFLGLFRDETSLITAEDLKLPATTREGYGYIYYNMFNGCSSMITAPKEISLLTFAVRDVGQMFYNCTSLTTAPYVKATTFTNNTAMESMFAGSNNNQITSLHFASFAQSGAILGKCGNANSLIVDADIPPTLTYSSIQGLKSNCIIYVPDESVQAYKEKQYWSARADYIKGISELPT